MQRRPIIERALSIAYPHAPTTNLRCFHMPTACFPAVKPKSCLPKPPFWVAGIYLAIYGKPKMLEMPKPDWSGLDSIGLD